MLKGYRPRRMQNLQSCKSRAARQNTPANLPCNSGSPWLVNFMNYDLGYFDEESKRVEPGKNPFAEKVSPM
jgi:hypothetical protein